jgi:hypothetical protein
VRNLVMMLAAYRSASDTDYFAAVQHRYRNFLAGTGRFLIGCTAGYDFRAYRRHIRKSRGP